VVICILIHAGSLLVQNQGEAQMTSLKQSSAEKYAVEFQNCEPSFYDRMPRILQHLTYDYKNPKTGKKEKRRLSVYAIHFYNVVKSIAGDKGACWKNRNNLAQLANMSPAQITSVKKELQQKFHQLDGNPLIRIDKMKKHTSKEGRLQNTTIYDKIYIIDIWKWNNAYMATIKSHKPETQEEMDDFDENEGQGQNENRGKGATSSTKLCSLGARSLDDPNKNTINENPLYIEQQSATEVAPVVSSKEKKSLPSEAQKICPKRQEFLEKPNQDQQAIAWLEKFGFDSKRAMTIAKRYPIAHIEKASIYYGNQMIKLKNQGKYIENRLAYFQSTLDNKYWEKTKSIN